MALFTRPVAAGATILLIVATSVLPGRLRLDPWWFRIFRALGRAVCTWVSAKGGATLSVDHAIGIEI